MIRIVDLDGERLVPQTEQEWLDMQPEAKLREMFCGDVQGMIDFAERLHDLDVRYSAWLAKQPARIFWRKHRWLIYVLAWFCGSLPRELRP